MTGIATRDRVIDIAMHLFCQNGVSAVGVDRIVRAAGITRTTLYNHFESRDSLLVAVVEKRDVWWQETFRADIRRIGGDDPVAQLRAVCVVLREWFARQDFRGCLFINAASEFPSPHDPVHKAAKANVDAIRSAIAEVAARAGIRNADAFAAQYNMIIEGAIITEVIDRDCSSAATAMALAEALIQHHLGRSPATADVAEQQAAAAANSPM